MLNSSTNSNVLYKLFAEQHTNIFDKFLKQFSQKKRWVHSPQPHIWVRVPSLNECENPIRAHALPTMGFTQATWAFCGVFAHTANIFLRTQPMLQIFFFTLALPLNGRGSTEESLGKFGQTTKVANIFKICPIPMISVSTASMVWWWWWYWWYYGEYAKLFK